MQLKASAEVVVVYVGVSLTVAVLVRVGSALPWLAPAAPLAVALLFVTVAYGLADREREGAERFGIDLGGVLSRDRKLPLVRTLKHAAPIAFRETLVAVGVVAVVFPLYVLGFILWHRPEGPFAWELPEGFASFVFSQFIVVALPEEALFRGYFQTRVADAVETTGWRPRAGPGASWGLACVVQGVLFGLLHALVDLRFERLLVFFPGLLFGWLRAWRGGIGAAIVVHALANITGDLLARGW